MKRIFILLLPVALFACNNNAEESKEKFDDMSGGDGHDTTTHVFIDPTSMNPIGMDSALRGEVLKAREIIFIGIDSTYSAIHQIDDIKNEIGDESSVELSTSERNIKAKAINKLNLIQNVLVRQVDSAMLVNLKQHTQQLAAINNSITNNVEHLKSISAKLDKVSAIMQRLTDVLSVCISRGLVKPPTPVNSTPAQVKEEVK